MIKQIDGQNFLEDSNLRIQTADNEVELSVFGRGYGECILIKHSDKYAVIDCFKNPATKRPIVLDYLDTLNVQSKKIDIVVITHWHEDHISGISEIIESAAPDVKIVLSPIIHQKSFLEFLSYSDELNNSNSKEFIKVMNYINNNDVDVVLASKNKPICDDDNGDIILKSLSPQDREVLEYITNLNAKLLNKEVSYEIPDNNDLSIALLFKFQNNGILLGSDLENKQDNNSGWNGIIKNYNDIKSKIFKVAHHGSITGHNDEIYTELLEDLPITICTTFNRGKKLPTDEDISRIRNLSKSLYVIGQHGKRNKEIEKLTKKAKVNFSIVSIPQNIGLVRYRYNLLNNEEKFEVFGEIKEYNNSQEN